ncbi:hypothetical protein FE257_005953 [Aspergillus nanangensis]|uniref:C2H2-type domain-containing protein n=1 Tax=Aspergillus nanangensis TaxID=2582783 RepID=A0AAD4CA10_ASPNN|nr:hypothetical protein FE257_005953 [Aspergillus nanangensis]
MDLFLYNPTYQIWICTAPRCQYAISPASLIHHLRTRHRSCRGVATPALRQAVLDTMHQQPWIDPEQEIVRLPPASSPPIPGLPVFQGYGCPHCGYICRSSETIKKHRRENRQDQDGRWGRGRHSVAQYQARIRNRLADRPVSCQRFFPTRTGSQFFEVTCSNSMCSSSDADDDDDDDGRRMIKDSAALKTPAAIIRARVNQALQDGQTAIELEDGRVPVVDPHPTAVSPWLELTRWPDYLRGQDLAAVALLGCMPDPSTEALNQKGWAAKGLIPLGLLKILSLIG